ncbi:hypothetical protein M3Y99_00977300 [Aphelenchoides fujianensis]|nr:hypothetical protein M3Y99_00977300 [Aphelenchoides fujianensis]
MNSPDVPIAMSVCKSPTAGRPLRFLYRVLRFHPVGLPDGRLTYQTACFCWVTAYSGRHLASAISIFCWQLQAWFAACILIYWQFKGHLQTLFSGISWEEFDFFNDHRLCTTYFRRYYALSGICWVASTAYSIFSVYLALTNNVHAIVNLLPEMFEIYGGRKSHFITLFVFYFSIVVWQAMLMVYVCISLSVHHELQLFNRRVANVGNKGESRETVARDLIVLYDRQVMLAGVVRKARTFQRPSSRRPTPSNE